MEQRLVIQMALINLGQRLFMNYGKADVIFVVDHQELPGHRLILGETCPYFDRLLCGDFEESKSKKVQITGTSAKVFKEVIRFIYLGELEIAGWKIDDLLALLALAHEYQFKQLIDAVTQALEKQQVDLDSWELVKSAASLYDSDALKAKCKSFVETKIDDFLSCKDLEKFRAEFIHSMLESPKLGSYNQDHLVSAICEWKNRHNFPGVSPMLSKINWSNVSPAINNLVLKDMFSNAKNEEDFGFWTKVAEMKKPQAEEIARVESLTLGRTSMVEFHLEKYQCFLWLYFRNEGGRNIISIDFRNNNDFVVIPVKRIEFELNTSFKVGGIYGRYVNIQTWSSEPTEKNGWFKYIAVLSDATPVFGINIAIQRDVQLSEIRLENIVIS